MKKFFRSIFLSFLLIILVAGNSSPQSNNYPAISMESFGDSMRHWYGIHDDGNIIQPKQMGFGYLPLNYLRFTQHT